MVPALIRGMTKNEDVAHLFTSRRAKEILSKYLHENMEFTDVNRDVAILEIKCNADVDGGQTTLVFSINITTRGVYLNP